MVLKVPNSCTRILVIDVLLVVVFCNLECLVMWVHGPLLLCVQLVDRCILLVGANMGFSFRRCYVVLDTKRLVIL